MLLFDRRKVLPDGNLGPGDIDFCPWDGLNRPCGTAGQALPLPPVVDSSLSETRPAFTDDGHCVGFIRSEPNGHERLFVWDTETQDLLNTSGVDLGSILAPDSGNLSLYEKPTFTFAGLSSLGLVSFGLVNPSGVALLVQRVVGNHRLFGHRVPTLRRVGRVPLGVFRRGRNRVRWNLRVAGHRLRPGTYQVTVRAVTPHLLVRDLGRPQLIHVR